MGVQRWELLVGERRERVVNGVRVMRSGERFDVVARRLTSWPTLTAVLTAHRLRHIKSLVNAGVSSLQRW